MQKEQRGQGDRLRSREKAARAGWKVTELQAPGVDGCGLRVHWFRPLCHPQVPPLPCVTSQGLSLQLRQGPVGPELQEHAAPRVTEAQSGRLIEVERSVSGGP